MANCTIGMPEKKEERELVEFATKEQTLEIIDMLKSTQDFKKKTIKKTRPFHRPETTWPLITNLR